MQQTPPTAADVKGIQRKHWNAVADGWAAWLEWTERNFAPISGWLRETGVWRPGTRILDVACGAGYPALAAAAVVAPEGRVVAADISPAMVAALDRRARSLGLTNVEVVETDAEQLPFEDEEFDAVTNTYGLMFCPDLQHAAAEAYRVLKPGGRTSIVTWDEPARSPFFATMLPLGATFLSLQPPKPDAPGPFRLSDPAVLETLLRESGFVDIVIERRTMVVECATADEYLQIFSDIAWKMRVASLPDADIARFRDAVVEATRPHAKDGRLHLAASSICASARKPAQHCGAARR